MAVSQINPGPEALSELAAEAARVRDSGVLGQSSLIVALFDFLLDHATNERSPKESEIALQVFSRPGDPTRGEDATVRAYVHRLRKRLGDYYLRPDAPRSHRLVIPRGEYRLRLELTESAPPPKGLHVDREVRERHRWLPVAGAVALVLAAALAWTFVTRPHDVDWQIATLRSQRLWAPLISSARPTSVILGDSYVFGDSVDGTRVSRLIRDPAINSRRDLDTTLMANPDFIGHHVDVGVHYLPISAAPALQKLLPVVTLPREDWRNPRTLAMSETTADRFKLSNVLYIGMLSALGPLREPMAAGSDVVTRLSQVDAPFHLKVPRSVGGTPGLEDYAYLSAFPGPNGNRIVIVAGLRDAGLLQAAEIATSPDRLEEIAAKVGDSDAFEALFGVSSIDTTNIGARLIVARRLSEGTLWMQHRQEGR